MIHQSLNSHDDCSPFLTQLKIVVDDKGGLLIGEFTALPFSPKRLFIQWGATAETTRGHHAHLSCWQILFPISGCINVDLEFCGGKKSFILDEPSLGLVIPPLVWATQTLLSGSAKLLVLASETFDENDYIRDRLKFNEILKSHTSHS
jgi:UDP-2-acetamido-3-amino-2,3-dideoxy-glucuronate N-acetyltransferase